MWGGPSRESRKDALKFFWCVRRPAFKAPAGNFPTTRDVYKLRKDLRGLVCGPLDKNPHELWFACPVAYRRAWDKLYDNDAYARVYPKPYSARTRQSMRDIVRTADPTPRKVGTGNDVVKAWERLYRVKQWNRYAPFRKTKVGFNLPYLLFKAKNMTEPEKRAAAWMKARPIAPQTKHPMQALFHLTGRAWSYITSHLPGENFVIKHGGQVTEFLGTAVAELRQRGTVHHVISDIEGCFPNMPKDAIRRGLRELLEAVTEAYGVDSITVPSKARQTCTFRVINRKGWTTVPFETLLEVMEFALDNTVIRDFEGHLRKQVDGIPMGDPHSPGMTIGTCVWMEQQWRATLPEDAPLRVRRYMDDVLVLYAKDGVWDHQGALCSLKRDCYLSPLRLEPGAEDVFLETQFRIVDGRRVRHWIKNDNRPGEPLKVWRYAHWACYSDIAQKKATLMACLGKVHAMASDTHALAYSAWAKIAEFLRLGYPLKVLWNACTTLGVRTREPAWFKVRARLAKSH